MGKKPSTYAVVAYAVNEFAVIKNGPRGGEYVIGRYKVESLAQDIAQALDRAEWARWR